MNKELHKKWLNGTLSEAEKELFEKSSDYPLARKITETAKRFSASQQEQTDPFTDFDPRTKPQTVEKTPVKQLRWQTVALRIAAVFVLGAALYFLFNQNGTYTIATAIGKQETVELPDASHVLLNADSQLHYDAGTWEEERIVSLKGEAWFKVAKGATFVVQTAIGNVTVLGTQFNVRQRDDYFEVSCYEGLVRVSVKEKEIKLPAGTSYRILGENPEVTKIKQLKPDWTKAISSFTNVPVRLVFHEIQAQYPIEIIDQSNRMDEHFTGSFTHTDLRTALRSITEPMNLTFTIENETKVYINAK